MKRIWHILLIVFTVAIISGTDSYAKSVLVIDNINEKAVRELDSRLSKKESFTLLIPGSKNDFKKNLRQVNTLLGKVNKQGVVLRCSLQKQNGKYCQIKVSSEQAKTYVYACKFINELFDRFKTGRLHGNDRWTYKCWHWETEDDIYRSNSEYKAFYSLYQKYISDGSPTGIKDYFVNYIKNGSDDYDEPRCDICDYYEATGDFYEKAAILYAGLFEAEHFSDLNEAQKAFFIHSSGYFCGTDIDELNYRNSYEYGMIYIFKSGNSYNKQSVLMKNLLENKAKGVCSDFARYEVCLFRSLGLKCWTNSNEELNHAWSVLKVKNNSGKSLWLPFDYGISPGPVIGQADYDSQEKYEYGFMLHMVGIKGAPLKQNFSIDDFIN